MMTTGHSHLHVSTMESKQTFQTLPIDCLLHIFKQAKLSLPEVLVFRTFSRQLKAAVDEHIRFVDTLPVILSSPSSRFKDSWLKEFIRDSWRNHEYEFGEVAFGLPSLGLTLYDDERILHKQAKHFRREGFVIVHHTPLNLNCFIDFISKYMPGVTKLALMIDYTYYWNDIGRILNLYRKQLKVLLLDMTSRLGLFINGVEMLVLPKEFYVFLEVNLEVLKELYFFPKRQSMLHFEGKSYEQHFIESMLRKLRVFTLNASGLDCFSSKTKNQTVFENLEEMLWIIWSNFWQYDEKVKFLRLKKVIIDWDTFDNTRFSEEKQLPDLEELHFDSSVHIYDKTIDKLNRSFPKLERIHCYRLYQGWDRPATLVNRTIKHIVIENLPIHSLNYEISVQELLSEAKRFLPNFAALRTITILEPFMELTAEELKSRY